MNLPALTVTVADMAAALERVAGPQASTLIDWMPDPAVAAIVTSWPARFRADRAARLGLAPDPDFDSIIRMYLAETKIQGWEGLTGTDCQGENGTHRSGARVAMSLAFKPAPDSVQSASPAISERRI